MRATRAVALVAGPDPDPDPDGTHLGNPCVFPRPRIPDGRDIEQIHLVVLVYPVQVETVLVYA